MAKKKNSTSALVSIAGLVALATIVLYLFTGIVKFKLPSLLGGEEKVISGVDVVFGYQPESQTILIFSFLALLTVLLMLGAIVMFFLAAYGSSRFAVLLGAVLLLAGSVLVFVTPQFMVFDDGLAGSIISNITDQSLTTLGIITGVVGILGSVLAGYELVRK